MRDGSPDSDSAIERYILALHTLALAGQRTHSPDSAKAAKHAKGLTSMASGVPVATVLIALVLFLQPLFVNRVAYLVLLIAALLSMPILGWWYTDRIFARRQADITEAALDIRNDPERGWRWAILRYFKRFAAASLIVAAIIVAIRWVLIQNGVVDGPLIRL